MKLLRSIRQRFANSRLRFKQEPLSYLVCWGTAFFLLFGLPSGNTDPSWYRELLSLFFAVLAAVYFSNIFLKKDLDGEPLTLIKRIAYAIQGVAWLLIFLQISFPGVLPGHPLIYYLVIPVLSLFFGVYASERGREVREPEITG